MTTTKRQYQRETRMISYPIGSLELYANLEFMWNGYDWDFWNGDYGLGLEGETQAELDQNFVDELWIKRPGGAMVRLGDHLEGLAREELG